MGHLLAKMLHDTAVGKFNHTPYKGAAPAMNDLLVGQVDMLLDGIGPAMQHITADKLKVLSHRSTEAHAQLPDVLLRLRSATPR